MRKSICASWAVFLAVLPLSAFAIFLEDGGTVAMEAENYAVISTGTQTNGHEWLEVTTADGIPANVVGTAMQASPPDVVSNYGTDLSGPYLEYQIRITNPGDYYVWIRGIAPSAQTDSVQVGWDGSCITCSEGFGLSGFPYSGEGATDFEWASFNAGFTNEVFVGGVTAGDHTLTLWAREIGLIIDRIVLSTDDALLSDGSTEEGPAESVNDTTDVADWSMY